METKIKLSDIEKALNAEQPDKIWADYVSWVQTLQPFWEKAIIRIADLTSFDSSKTAKHLLQVANAFGMMNDWRYGKIKYVKARRNEIDSAISFLRNSALQNAVSPFLFAGMCRNAAGVLRQCLYISTYSYSNEQLPNRVAEHIYEIAALRTNFPLDLFNLDIFHPRKTTPYNEYEAKVDDFHVMLEKGGEALDLTKEIQAINDEANFIWTNFGSSVEWKVSENIWTDQTNEMSKIIHYAMIDAFHNKI